MGGLSKLSPFQLTILGVFSAFIVIGVILFATFSGEDPGPPPVTLTVWGFMEREEFADWIERSGVEEQLNVVLNYSSKQEESFEQELIRALAGQNGPDIFFLPSDSVGLYDDLVLTMPPNVISAEEFRRSFVRSAEDIYRTADGFLGLPVIVDPVVMFWNRDILFSEGVTAPPQYWEDLDSFAPRFTRRSGSTITQSAFPLGEYANITHAKDIITTLILQSGGQVTVPGTRRSALQENRGLSRPPAVSAVSFFVDFSDPSKDLYTWNRSLPDSIRYFAEGRSALYFGRASDLFEIQSLNPNLDYDIAELPQLRESGDEGGVNRVTGARMQALAIAHNSSSPNRSLSVVRALTGELALGELEGITGLPPVRLSMLQAGGSGEPARLASESVAGRFGEVMYNSAIRSRGWQDPNPNRTDTIFQDMIESITAGRESVTDAVRRAHEAINNI